MDRVVGRRRRVKPGEPGEGNEPAMNMLLTNKQTPRRRKRAGDVVDSGRSGKEMGVDGDVVKTGQTITLK